MGLTNIDDKIIARANELGVSPQVLADRFELDFFNDMKLYRNLHSPNAQLLRYPFR